MNGNLTPIVALMTGGALTVFGFGRWPLAPAAWLAPLLLLHYSRSAASWRAMALLWVILFVALIIAEWDVIPLPLPLYLPIVALIAAAGTLPYALDRALVPALWVPVSTLVFPAALVTSEFLLSRLSPFGTWGSVAYTQADVTPLIQIVAVTGIWGITFLIGLVASAGQGIVAGGWSHEEQRSAGAIAGAVVAAVLLVGGLRIWSTSDAATVRVAAVQWPAGLVDETVLAGAVAPTPLTDDQRTTLAGLFGSLHDALFAASNQAASSGAQVILWPESSALAFVEDLDRLRQRASEFAASRRLYLALGVGVIDRSAPRPYRNLIEIWGPDGGLVATTVKTHLVPGFEAEVTTPGEGRIATGPTDLGRVGGVICFDLDFPDLIRQLGQSGTDLTLVPASDWRAIGWLHAAMARFRAIENGSAMLRAARRGYTEAVDPLGRVVGQLRDPETTGAVLVADLPARRTDAIYPVIGDLFAYLCLLGIVALAIRQLVLSVRS